MSFDASFDCERIFLMDFLKIVEKISFTFVDGSGKLYIRLHNKSELSLMTPAGLHGEAVESFSGCARS